MTIWLNLTQKNGIVKTMPSFIDIISNIYYLKIIILFCNGRVYQNYDLMTSIGGADNSHV